MSEDVELKDLDRWTKKRLRAKVREQEATIVDELDLTAQLRREIAELREVITDVIGQCGEVGKALGISGARRVAVESRNRQLTQRLREAESCQ